MYFTNACISAFYKSRQRSSLGIIREGENKRVYISFEEECSVNQEKKTSDNFNFSTSYSQWIESKFLNTFKLQNCKNDTPA